MTNALNKPEMPEFYMIFIKLYCDNRVHHQAGWRSGGLLGMDTVENGAQSLEKPKTLI